MEARILDLDGSLAAQPALAPHCRARTHEARDWGPRIRLGCSFRRFNRFQETLATLFGGPTDDAPCLTWFGSGDFHHVTLALLRRLTTPFNLLVLDNHPDWMRRVPLMHCGTWLWHASRLPLMQHIFHVGGNVDFDNYYRWLAPWSGLRDGRIRVFPAVRRYRHFPWNGVDHEPLRARAEAAASAESIEQAFWPFRDELSRWPLYISLDKDVLVENQSIVNWDSGWLNLTEVSAVLETCWRLAEGRLAGVDIVGDWSPVCVEGWLRHLLHLTEHPALRIDPAEAARRNQQTNLKLLDCPALRVALAESHSIPSAGAEVA